ncbi:MAG: ATP-binding protein, partial [Panacibacter sp.]
ININTQNFVPLIGLPPGTYTLEVKAANEDGYWCAPKQLTLIFEPKWYQTLWFKIAVGLLIAGLFYAFYRYRISQIKKQQQIRKEIASDLHDDIGSTLNSVKIFTHLAETAPQKEEYFNQIKEALKQASTGLRDMIWVLDDTQDTAEELIKRLKQFALPVANASNIHIEFIADNNITTVLLNKTEKRNLLLIAKEAINNSIKYAECKNIHVNISKVNGKTALQIQDDGKGFNMNDITPGDGLKNMQDRARQINYKVTIDSSSARGTIIILTGK